MKVHIYRLDVEKEIKGDLIGIIRYRNGKVELDIDDDKLHKLISKNIKNHTSESKNSIYYVSTAELVEDINVQCWKNGYVAEIIE